MGRDVARARRGRRCARVIVGVASTFGALAVVAMLLWPGVLAPIVANATGRVVPADETVTLGDGDRRIDVTAPAGWSVQHPPFVGERVDLVSPDGSLRIRMTPTTGAWSAADARIAQTASRTTVMTERLSSGMLSAHADGDARTIVAVVGDDASTRVEVTASLESGDIAPYRRAIAGVLDSVRVRS